MDASRLTFEVHPASRVLVDAAERIAAALGECLEASGSASLALSGGNSTVGLCEALARMPIDWKAVDVFQVDERAVPPDHEDSNFRLIELHLLRRLGPAAPRCVRMRAEVPDPHEAARSYAAGLPSRLDVVVLGIGPDGHTASLFPGSALLDETTARVAVIDDSPKPPPRRMTLTLPTLNAARWVFGIAIGEGKREIVRRLRAGEDLPASRVQPACWFLDPAAAGEDAEAPTSS